MAPPVVWRDILVRDADRIAADPFYETLAGLPEVRTGIPSPARAAGRQDSDVAVAGSIFP
jgi:hypothetical protein